MMRLAIEEKRLRSDRRKPATDRLSDKSVVDLPTHVGPVVFGQLGTVQCPREFNALMRRARGACGIRAADAG
jgi:hypothetical protein